MEPVATTITRKRVTTKRTSFFFVMSWVFLFASIAGFATTFIIPVATGKFKAPAGVYLHGAFAFGWVMLFFIQTFLIRVKSYKKHIALGTIGMFTAIGTALTMVYIGKYSVDALLAKNLGDESYSAILGVIISGIVFLALVVAGYIKRKRPQVHKRLLLLATIVLLWPAWFRFRHYFPSVPRPEIWFAIVLADSLIIIAWIRDLIATKKIHPVLLYVGSFIIIEQSLELYFYDSPGWRALSKMVYGLF